MSQTKTRGMVCSSNVSDKNKGYDILFENLRQKKALWYTPRMSQKKTWVMVYSSKLLKKNKGYDIHLKV
jgi:hypothetical protein